MSKKLREYKAAKDLPLYTAVYRLLWKADDIMSKMDRDHKHTIGQKIVDLVLDMFDDIRVANDYMEERAIYINKFLSKYDVVSTLIKFCTERSYIDKKLYVETMPLLSNISRQAGGWLKYTQANSQSSSLEDTDEEECILSKAGLVLPASEDSPCGQSYE